MKRLPINLWSWSLHYGDNQAEILEGTKRQLICAGQTAVDAEGKPQHIEDTRNQIRLALDNLATVLGTAEMGFATITRLTLYTTDVDEAIKHFDIFGARFGPLGVNPPMTLLGITRLALAELMIEIEASAAD